LGWGLGHLNSDGKIYPNCSLVSCDVINDRIEKGSHAGLRKNVTEVSNKQYHPRKAQNNANSLVAEAFS
jgi:hypothetical protein